MNTAQSTATKTALSYRDLGELVRIRESLRVLSSGAAILQAAEDSLYSFSANLEQMKLLALKILSDRYDDEIIAAIAAEFDELNRRNRQIAAAAFDGQQIHRDGALFDLYTDGQASIVWTSQSLPEVEPALLDQPEAVFQSLQTAITRVTSCRRDIQALLASLRSHSDAFYCQFDKLFTASAPAEKSSAGTAAMILRNEWAADSAHSNKIKAAVPVLLN